jgi:ketosteroid isomerase-like protein
MKKLLLVIPLVILLCFTFACQAYEEAPEEPAVDVEAEKANIRMVLDQYAEAWKSLNIDHFSKIFSHDVDMVIFDSEKRYVGGEAWKVNVTFRDYSIKVHRSGTIAWLSSLEDATWISQDQPNEVKGMRVTWVLEKIEGNWVIVQGHWSVSEQEETE